MAERQPHFAQQWLRQWQNAAVELEKIRRDELRALSDADALLAIDALLSLPAAVPDDRWKTSGLVEQQRRFARVGRERR
ncbi:MAG TPA: hypothetical protein VGH20_15240 [Myxococcales bacterium]|jgi:hypothetical protein